MWEQIHFFSPQNILFLNTFATKKLHITPNINQLFNRMNLQLERFLQIILSQVTLQYNDPFIYWE
jgi:hypothetical protein